MSYGKARSVTKWEDVTQYAARDEFAQAAGNLAGKVLPIGGTWGGDGDGDDFTIDTGGATAQRTATLDTDIYSGRYGIAGATTATDVLVQADIKYSTSLPPALVPYHGVFARYSATTDWVGMWLEAANNILYVIKNISGTPTTIATISAATELLATDWKTMRLTVLESGEWRAWLWEAGMDAGEPVAVGADNDFEVGQALGQGKFGIYDNYRAPQANTRHHDNFYAAVPEPDAVIFSGRSAKFFHDAAMRASEDGSYFGRVPAFEGEHLEALAAGQEGRKSRIIVKARRLDVDSGLPDWGLTDGLTADLAVTPRVLLTGSE